MHSDDGRRVVLSPTSHSTIFFGVWIMKRFRISVMLLGCLAFSSATVAQELSAKSDPILTLEEAASPHEFFAQFGKDYIPPVVTVALLESVGGDVTLFDREVDGMQLTIYWDSAIGGLEIWKDGDWIDDLRVQYGDRIVFSGAFEDRVNRKSGAVTLVATVTGSIVAGPETTLIVSILNYRGVVPAGGVSAAGHEGGPFPKDPGLVTCNCFGLGTGGTCTDDDCDEGKSCGTNRACRWSAGTE